MHEMSQGAWISSLPFICATPQNCYSPQQLEFMKMLVLTKRVHTECGICVFTDCIRKCCCHSESLARAVTCISYFASAVMAYNSNTITLRDSVMGIESQWHSSTEVFFFLQHNRVGNSSTRALKFYVNKWYFTELKATGKSCCIHKHMHATGLSPSDTSLSCRSFKIPRKKYVSVHSLFFSDG